MAVSNDLILADLKQMIARLGAIESRLAAIESRMASTETRLEHMATQEDIDALAQQVSDEADAINTANTTIEGHVSDLNTAETAIATEIANLQAQIAQAGVTLDFSALQNNVSNLVTAGNGIASAAGDLGGSVSNVQGLVTPPA
jgi:predicted  nucleic acid-binding Zn-ribbon protein